MTPSNAVSALHEALQDLHPQVRCSVQLDEDQVVLEVQVYDEDGELSGAMSGGLDLGEDPSRAVLYMQATAQHLRSRDERDPDVWLAALSPAGILLQSPLRDPSLNTLEDFLALVADSSRLERARRLDSIWQLLGARPTLEDAAIDVLYPLTFDGRAELEWADTVEAWRALVQAEEDHALVAAMGGWTEEYDPDDTLWEGGPTTSDLLVAGTWRALEGRLTGELRLRALDCLNRLADESRPTDEDLQQAELA